MRPAAAATIEGEGKVEVFAGTAPSDHAGQFETVADPADELWVIVRRPSTTGQPRVLTAQNPGCGVLVATHPPQVGDDGAGGTVTVPMPLTHTAVEAGVTGYVSSVSVTQTFENPFSSKIEAEYVFPLPESAAVDGFLMTIGDRTIRGVIRERAEAKEIYAAARARGHVASLMTQERANVFTQRVANIEPGKSIDVEISYHNTLAYRDGWFEFVFPMVVGTRFNPASVGDAGDEGDGIGAVPRGDHPLASGQATQVAYLAPSERSGHDVSLRLTVEAGVVIEDTASVNHRVDVLERGGSRAMVEIAREDRIPNKDFVFRWRVAGHEVKPGLVIRPDSAMGGEGEGGYFSMMLVPPVAGSGASTDQPPMELVFVLDCSGSMNGRPMEQAKAAVEAALGALRSTDTFQIIRFSESSSAFSDRPVAADPERVRDAVRYVRELRGGGGTMMIEGIKASLDEPPADGRTRYVAFLTDGFIGNETEILDAMEERLGSSRVFSFGVGSSPNRMLLERMARIGRGAVAYLSLGDDAVEVMTLYLERVRTPALTHVEIDFGPLEGVEAYPRRLPDLHAGRPIVVTGRYERLSSGAGEIRITGRRGRTRVAERVQVVVGGHEVVRKAERSAATALRPVWARMKIAALMDEMAIADASRTRRRLASSVREVALEHGLMSSYTAFIAVDSLTRTDGTFGTTVPVAVPVPDGVRYDTTVGVERGAGG